MRAGAISVVLVGLAAIVCSRAVVAFQEPAATTAAAAGPRSIWDGVYSEEQAARGEKLYADKCSNCHGRQLTGNDGPTLTGADFAANWNNQTLKDLFDKIQNTMPQDNPNLMPQQSVDLVSVILKHEEVPAGATELPTQAAALKSITFLSVRPQK